MLQKLRIRGLELPKQLLVAEISGVSATELTPAEQKLALKLPKFKDELACTIEFLKELSSSMIDRKRRFSPALVSTVLTPLINTIKRENDIGFAKAVYSVLCEYQKLLKKIDSSDNNKEKRILGSMIPPNELVLFTKLLKRNLITRTFLNPSDKPIIIIHAVLKETERKGRRLTLEELNDITSVLNQSISDIPTSEISHRKIVSRINSLYEIGGNIISFANLGIYSHAIIKSSDSSFETILRHTRDLKRALTKNQMGKILKRLS